MNKKIDVVGDETRLQTRWGTFLSSMMDRVWVENRKTETGQKEDSEFVRHWDRIRIQDEAIIRDESCLPVVEKSTDSTDFLPSRNLETTVMPTPGKRCQATRLPDGGTHQVVVRQ